MRVCPTGPVLGASPFYFDQTCTPGSQVQWRPPQHKSLSNSDCPVPGSRPPPPPRRLHMLFDKKTVSSLVFGLAAFPGALAIALHDSPTQLYGRQEVSQVFNLVNADIKPVGTPRLSGCQYSSSRTSRTGTLAPLFSSTGEPFDQQGAFFAILTCPDRTQ